MLPDAHTRSALVILSIRFSSAQIRRYIVASAQNSKNLSDGGDVQPSGGRGHGVLEAARQTSPSHEVAVGDFDPPGMADGAKDLGAVFVAWRLVPSNPADLVVEPCGQPFSCRLRGAPVHEHEFEAFIGTGSGEVVEYLFDGVRLGRRGGDDSYTERQTGDVHADNAFGPVGPTVRTTLVVEGDTPVRGSSCKVGVYDHHRGSRVLATERRARRGVQRDKNTGPRSVPRPPAKLGPDAGPRTELPGQEAPLAPGV